MPAIDMTGERYGRLTVLERDYSKPKGHAYWYCQCDCGNITSVSRNNLRNGSVQSCGCLAKELTSKRSLIDLTGQKFGRLTVLQRDESKPKGHQCKVYWICQCECGTIKSIQANSLRNGECQSCGCLQRERASKSALQDLTGQQFGFLVPLYRLKEKKWKKSIWHCKCLNCGGTADVVHSYLTTGETKSCGCLGRSYGEEKITQILKDNNIDFKPEYTFEDLKSRQGVKLRFDFAIFKEKQLYCLIEFQGDQHSKPVNRFGGEEGYQRLVENDKRKKEYCKSHNISLIEIFYKDKDKLSWEYLKEKCNL